MAEPDRNPASSAGGRLVPCPTCRQPALFAPANPWRPFCSARCRGADLGAWASEDYRVPAAPPAEPDEARRIEPGGTQSP